MGGRDLTVKVVIPIYQEQLPDLELKLLRHNLEVLSQHRIVILLPESLSLEQLRGQFPIDRYEIVRVSDEWLGRKRGIAGYNRMMLSEGFYALFSDVDYILICQTDVYIFRDELSHWASKGYDYIGAPWLKRSIYNNPLMRLYLAMRLIVHRRVRGERRKFLRQELFTRVGNGGLSLRRVESMRSACVVHHSKIEEMLSERTHLNNEDVFWALVPYDFRYPNYEEALRFSLDVKPELGVEVSNGALPFGCHGLTHRSIFKFWREKIDILSE